MTASYFQIILINFDLLALIWSNLSFQYKNFHLANTEKNQSNTDILCIGPIPVSPITARSESARRFYSRKEKSRVILNWLINKGIIT